MKGIGEMTAHDPVMVSPSDLVLERDARASLVHVRIRKTGECLGCIGAGLFDLLRTLILADVQRVKR